VRSRTPFAALVVAGATAVALAACSSGTTSGATSPSSSASGSTTSTAITGTVNVFAAASLQESFTTLKKQFEAAHPGVTITPNFGASSALATGITQGQPADVFASASQTNMDAVVKAGAAASSTPFAKNVGAIAVPAANPAGIASVNDLAKQGVKVAVCQAQVPCGGIATKVFANAKITVTPVSQEADVKAVLTKVSLGEVDAGIVYVTDVKSAGDKVKGIEIPADVNASTTYPIAALTKATNPTAAQAFVDYVLSPDGMAVLKAGGFASP
jgi:molybdate transport system substrate-binding protein